MRQIDNPVDNMGGRHDNSIIIVVQKVPHAEQSTCERDALAMYKGKEVIVRVETCSTIPFTTYSTLESPRTRSCNTASPAPVNVPTGKPFSIISKVVPSIRIPNSRSESIQNQNSERIEQM